MALLFSFVSSAATPINGLYSTVFGGYAYLPSNINHNYNNSTLSNAKYQAGFEAGGAIGYKANPMRYEGDITYIQANINSFYLNNTRQTGTSGNDQTILAMANVYYDFSSLYSLIEPYIGGGVGYGWFQARLNSTGPSTAVAFKPNNSAVAYQGMAGVTFNFAENYALNLNYRYVGSSHLGSFGKMFQAHIANLGATYRFDGNKYK